MKCNLSGVILAGGEGKRIGGIPKTELIVKGEKIITLMLRVISDIFDDIIIVTNSPERYSGYNDCRIIRDIFRGSGPLGGIHAAMKASSKKGVFVFAGDMPLLNRDMINKQIELFSDGKYSALVPVIEDLEEPLHAIYNNNIIVKTEKILEGRGERAVKKLLREINTGFLRLPPTAEIRKAFTNINTLTGLEQAENIYL